MVGTSQGAPVVATPAHVRDSKVPEGPTFAVAPGAWATFLTWANRPFAGSEASGPANVYDLWTP
ncbi:DUF397 domain-containing protein [Streptomyces atratus]|uniref:DUF397 domain-containing protein n=1 Tax=Streptomyces atratus TaxID=1893 RepID=UPI003529B402